MLDENPYSSLVVFNGLLVSCWLRAVSLNHSDSDKHKTNDNKVFKKGEEKQTKEQKAYGGILLNITKEKCVQWIKEKKYLDYPVMKNVLVVQCQCNYWLFKTGSPSADTVISSVIAFKNLLKTVIINYHYHYHYQLPDSVLASASKNDLEYLVMKNIFL